MRVNTQSVNFRADKKLLQFIEKRMQKLEKYYSRVLESNVYLKVSNIAGKENKIVEASLVVPGDKLVVKKSSKSFEESTDSVVTSLERQLKKRKGKLRPHA